MGGPLASVRAEAASLLQLLLDVAGKYGRNIRLLIFIDCLVLLDILRKWGTHNFHPLQKEVVIYPLLPMVWGSGAYENQKSYWLLTEQESR